MNMILVGAVVLFLHDPCDVFLILIRAYTDYKHRNVIINSLLGKLIITHMLCLGLWAILSWIFLRNFVFPTCVINACINFYQRPKDDALLNIV